MKDISIKIMQEVMNKMEYTAPYMCIKCHKRFGREVAEKYDMKCSCCKGKLRDLREE